MVRSKIGLTGKFKKSGKPIEIVIEPLKLSQEKGLNRESSKIMSSEAAEEVLNEVIPAANRGNLIGKGNAEFGCTSSDYTQYEQVLINVVTRCEQQGAGTYFISIR